MRVPFPLIKAYSNQTICYHSGVIFVINFFVAMEAIFKKILKGVEVKEGMGDKC